MTRRSLLLLFILGLGITAAAAVFQTAPGYMDADYYYVTGARLASGAGFSEPFLWNYLDDPAGLPHPSHAYWMPLASLAAALGIFLTGSFSFTSARLVFLLVAGLVPPVTAQLCFVLGGRRDHAALAGILAALPGFYLAYIGSTDTFGIYMVLGGLWMLFAASWIHPAPAGRRLFPRSWLPFGLGLVAGCMHLARADGILWFGLGLWVVLLPGKRNWDGTAVRSPGWLASLVLCLIGYFAIMGPWFARNLAAFGTPLSPAGVRTLWITGYDEIFSYPSQVITPARWLASGWRAILSARGQALGQNLQTALAVQGEIFLAPLILAGMWKLRADGCIRLGTAAWILTLGLMTVIFPFIGWRGGFFHAGAALQPLFWAVVPAGLEIFVNWGARVRRWSPSGAFTFFRAGLVGLALMLTLFTAGRRILGTQIWPPEWNQSAASYTRLEAYLQSLGAGVGDVVLVNNPPGYYAAASRPAIPVPNGDLNTAFEVARRYQAQYLILEANHPAGLGDAYQFPADRDGWRFLGSYDDARFFEITAVP